ncbi:AIPR protein [Vibrio crassostreae]|uniref:AIPR family protein n=1 Tax=Vibrio crassostreae TaxID=246167 RepID=UPI001051C708|nr:AIPR family protein [Vibrio crassostreae]TCN79879.1 AIPR protein [Vibrio crassostreae]TWD73776.1 AIPR protein [Vibrio crassostreae]
MKDEILKSFLSGFCDQNNFVELNEDEQFEMFSNFNVVSKLYPREVNVEDLSTGGQDDLAIDGAAIIVNGTIVRSEEEINFLRERNGTLDVVFALIQSKNSAKFKGEQIGNFIFGVKSLFDESPSIPENEQVTRVRQLKDHIYQHSIDFEEPPTLKLYFVTTGEWKEPEQIVGKVERELKDLDDRHLFNNKAHIEFYDAERLKLTYRELSRKSVKEVPFNNHVALPDMPNELNVRQSFIGSLPVKHYIELITNNDGNLSKGLFYDNVRDFQGINKVNKEIHETLKSSMSQSLLPLLNNGITIIAKKVDKVGSKLKLSDFQIVNGCQSSHVLFENRTILSEDTHIVVKIIETNDQDVINNIIRATNRQTEVKDEAFESLKPFHKDLEEYYKAKVNGCDSPIYYERRSKEYLDNPKVKSYQVITLASQVKSYVSLVLEQPQSTHRYFGEILDSNKEKLFNSSTNLLSYYTSSLIVNRVEMMFRTKILYKSYKEFRYHIAFVVYLMLKKEYGKNTDRLLAAIHDKESIKQLMIEACKIIARTRKESGVENRDAIRSRDFTQKLKAKV